VKPIHLNLAARPYRDYRPVYAVVVVLSLLTAFLMLNNVETYYRYVHETQATRAKIAQVEEQTRLEAQREQAARNRLKGLDLARLDDQTRFINAKLAERAFSWSRLLDELESILADDVRLVSVSPSFAEDGRIALSLSFQAKSADGMITTINRMNADPQFADAFPSTESQDDAGIFSFNLTASYNPEQPAGLKTLGVAR
jgi:type IV pilus assembly protein PilN